MGRTELANELAELKRRRIELQRELKNKIENGLEVNDKVPEVFFPSISKMREDELAVVEQRIADLETALDLNGGKAVAKGELKVRVEAWAKSERLGQGETVPSKKIAKFVRALQNEGVRTSEASVRAILSKLGYSAEKSLSDT